MYRLYIKYIIHITYGKIINTLTESSSQICYMCECNPKNMNDIDKMQNFQVNEEHF